MAYLQSRIEVEFLVKVSHVIVKALLGPRLAGEVLLEVKSDKVEHVPQVGVVGVLHEDLAQALDEPGALGAVPVGNITRECGVGDENVLPAELLRVSNQQRDNPHDQLNHRLMRGPRMRPLTSRSDHSSIRCTTSR